ncbi:PLASMODESMATA CALLOSE-BINDING PROTEIN 3-like [Chenopodium quinoa]|uniref:PLASMODESMATA CALLOSE-BINDING PROTEIN 3-like n=1 Tax=Chenopodium quinoa TaxID=63459 RepID=UPI000B78CEF0|nr:PLASMODESMATA CALLOSE-BINDING PROTEIN 3-like [Chenopodium quinoa]
MEEAFAIATVGRRRKVDALMLFHQVPKTMLLQQRNLLVLIVEAGVWCIANEHASDAELQSALDYACGAGADCTKIQEYQPCYFPNTVKDHASYAFNSYFQKNNYLPHSCDFGSAAVLTTLDPSHGECKFDYSTFFEDSSKVLDII